MLEASDMNVQTDKTDKTDTDLYWSCCHLACPDPVCSLTRPARPQQTGGCLGVSTEYFSSFVSSSPWTGVITR